jgi:hypothetical protein
MNMSDATQPMLAADAIGTVRTGRELGWQRWRDRWGVPLFLACLPMLLLILSGELASGLQKLGSADRAWHHAAEPSSRRPPLDSSEGLQPGVAPGAQPGGSPALHPTLQPKLQPRLKPPVRPKESALATPAMLAYLAVSVFGLRVALRDCYPQTWMGLTRSERNEFEALAASSEAVEALRTRVAVMQRGLVVQDLIQARRIARLTGMTARLASSPVLRASQRYSAVQPARQATGVAAGMFPGARPAPRSAP